MLSDQERTDIFARTINHIALSLDRPILFGADNKPLSPSPHYTYQRTAAKRTGSMKNWMPKRLSGSGAVSMQRERIVERSVDLVENDPNAAGVVDNFATTTIGSGLVAQPDINYKLLGMDKDAGRAVQEAQREAYQIWQGQADAGQRMSFGQIQYLVMRQKMEYGEYLVTLPMIKDPLRAYSLACLAISPMRLKTPVDLANDPRILDGVELGEYGEPVAYWIKKTTSVRAPGTLADVKANFLRMPAKVGHRWNVLHGFDHTDSEMVRGVPAFAAAMKWFRDLNDYLDAELVSNIVTAAFALFIEVNPSSNPFDLASLNSSDTRDYLNANNESEEERYQEMIPGTVMYGNPGQKPHPITATRPGTTFEPFTKVIKKAIALSMGIPYPVLFKDVDGINFAGFRSAMLDAWRVYMMHRTNVGQNFCQPIYGMLQEEAWLRGHLPGVTDFYSHYHHLTQCDWIGTPKGDIEPFKAVQADEKEIALGVKTRQKAIVERGGNYRQTLEQLKEEKDDFAEAGINTAAGAGAVGSGSSAAGQAVEDALMENEGG